MSVQPLPEMTRPPVVEVVCGAFFSPIEKLDGLAFGAYWAQRRSTFPERQLRAAVSDAPELVLTPELPPARGWLISATGEYIVQLQRDRFYLNWRAEKAKQYPRFHDTPASRGIAALLADEFQEFSSFCAELVGETPEPLQADLSKINTLVHGVHWQNFADLKKVLPILSHCDTAMASDEPDVNVSLVDNREWSMLIKIQSGLEGEGQKRRIVRLEIRARQSVTADTLFSGFGTLNDKINATFGNLIPRDEMIARFGGAR